MHFFEALLHRLGLDKQIEIRNFRGIGDFKTFLIDLAKSADFQRMVTSVGVVRDAENQPVIDARKSVEDALAAAGLTPHRKPPIQTSIFILPDNTNPGMIETLCMEAVKSEPTLADAYRCVEEFFACLTRNRITLPAPPKIAKNYAQAYLATRKEVQMFPGIAAYYDYWPWDAPAFQPLIRFLQSLLRKSRASFLRMFSRRPRGNRADVRPATPATASPALGPFSGSAK
jgi:hypothetical protein